VRSFETSHRLLMQGDAARNIAPVKLPAARPHLQRVDQIWQRYRPAVIALAAGRSAHTAVDHAALAADAEALLAASTTVETVLAARPQLQRVDQIWQRYRPAVIALAAGRSTNTAVDHAALAADAEAILAASNEVVTLIAAETTRSSAQQLWVAMASTLSILLL